MIVIAGLYLAKGKDQGILWPVSMITDMVNPRFFYKLAAENLIA